MDGVHTRRADAHARAQFPISQLGVKSSVTKANYRVVLVHALNLHNDGPEMTLAAEAQFQRGHETIRTVSEHCLSLSTSGTHNTQGSRERCEQQATVAPSYLSNLLILTSNHLFARAA